MMQQGELAEAVDNFERAAAKLSPDLVAVTNNLGLAAPLNLGRVEDAQLPGSSRLCVRDRTLAELHNNLGLALAAAGAGVEEARGRFPTHAAILRPEWADAHNNLGVALAALGMPDEALACYEQKQSAFREPSRPFRRP